MHITVSSAEHAERGLVQCTLRTTKGGPLMNQRGPSRRERCLGARSISVALLLALAGVVAATPAVAGSAKAAFTVSATVVPNCTTRGLTMVCTKGVTAPKTSSLRTSESIGPFQEGPSGSRTTSETDQARSITVT